VFGALSSHLAAPGPLNSCAEPHHGAALLPEPDWDKPGLLIERNPMHVWQILLLASFVLNIILLHFLTR
jgi:hypothetical protein